MHIVIFFRIIKEQPQQPLETCYFLLLLICTTVCLHSCREQFLQCRHPPHVYLGEWNPVCCLQCCPELLCAKYPGVQPSLRRWSVWVCSGSTDTQVFDKCPAAPHSGGGQSVLLLCIVTRLIQALLYLIQLSSRWVLIE